MAKSGITRVSISNDLPHCVTHVSQVGEVVIEGEDFYISMSPWKAAAIASEMLTAVQDHVEILGNFLTSGKTEK